MLESPNNIYDEWNSVREGLDGILAEHGYIRKDRYYKVGDDVDRDKTIVIFCHFGVTMVMLSHLLGISAQVLLHGCFMPPTSVTIVNSEERIDNTAYFRCQVMGDVTHLHMGNEPISQSGYFGEIFQEKF